MYYIVSSTCPSGGRIHTRHYSLLSILSEMTWRALNRHTDIVCEDNQHNYVYAL